MTETIRWESLPHEQICYEVHTAGAGVGLSVAGSVPVWQEVTADLNEVRALYESAMRRFRQNNAGANADAAQAQMRLAVDGLTEAQQRAHRAGVQRARLHELNLQLRWNMPDPVRPVEHTDFLSTGVAWLSVQDFQGADNRQHNAAERARELMRAYEDATQPARLAEGTPGSLPAYTTPPPAYSGLPDERTIPRVFPPSRVDPELGQPIAQTTDITSGDGFGPTGYTTVEPPLDEPQPGKDDDTPKAGAGFAGGNSALGGDEETRRPQTPWAGDDPFGPDNDGFPPVIGG